MGLLAKTLATEAFANVLDKGGQPYIGHCQRIAAKMPNKVLAEIAWLHDLVEDTPWTLAALKRQGFSKVCLEALDALTHRKGESYFDYIERVRQNPDAVQVKIADLEDNMDLSRLPVVTEKDLQRNKKYQKALQMLSNGE